jgi:putative flippase GtrA
VTAALLAVFGREVMLVHRGTSRRWSRETLLSALAGGSVALLGHELLRLLIAVEVTAGMANVLQAVATLQLNFLANRHLTWRRRIAGSGVGIWTRWRRFQLARGAGLLLRVAAFPQLARVTGPSAAY